jgi:hypothetical protein
VSATLPLFLVKNGVPSVHPIRGDEMRERYASSLSSSRNPSGSRISQRKNQTESVAQSPLATGPILNMPTVTLRGFSACRSQTAGRAVRMALHAQALQWALAESELGVLSAQCLDRRIPEKETLIDEITAWEHDRNSHHTKSDWHFTTKDACIKLKHLYPSI